MDRKKMKGYERLGTFSYGWNEQCQYLALFSLENCPADFWEKYGDAPGLGLSASEWAGDEEEFDEDWLEDPDEWDEDDEDEDDDEPEFNFGEVEGIPIIPMYFFYN